MVNAFPKVWPVRMPARVRSRLVRLARASAGDEIGLCTPLEGFRTVRKGYDLEEKAR